MSFDEHLISVTELLCTASRDLCGTVSLVAVDKQIKLFPANIPDKPGTAMVDVTEFCYRHGLTSKQWSVIEYQILKFIDKGIL